MDKITELKRKYDAGEYKRINTSLSEYERRKKEEEEKKQRLGQQQIEAKERTVEDIFNSLKRDREDSKIVDDNVFKNKAEESKTNNISNIANFGRSRNIDKPIEQQPNYNRLNGLNYDYKNGFKSEKDRVTSQHMKFATDLAKELAEIQMMTDAGVIKDDEKGSAFIPPMIQNVDEYLNTLTKSVTEGKETLGENIAEGVRQRIIQNILSMENVRKLNGLPNQVEAIEKWLDEHPEINPDANLQGKKQSIPMRSTRGAADVITLGVLSKTQALPEAAKYTAIGGAAGGIAGNFIPGAILAPEETLTVPAGAYLGFKYGMTTASAKYMMQLEAGASYSELLEDGIDPRIAKPLAQTVGFINGLIEYAEVELAFKGLKGLQAPLEALREKAIKKGIYGLGKLVAQYGGQLLAEATQEVLQENVGMVAEDVGNWIKEREKNPEYNGESTFVRAMEGIKVAGKSASKLVTEPAKMLIGKEYDKDYMDIMFETAKETIVSMALLPVGSTMVRQGTKMVYESTNQALMDYNKNKNQLLYEDLPNIVETAKKNKVDSIEDLTTLNEMLDIVNQKDDISNKDKKQIYKITDDLKETISNFIYEAKKINPEMEILPTNFIDIEKSFLKDDFDINSINNNFEINEFDIEQYKDAKKYRVVEDILKGTKEGKQPSVIANEIMKSLPKKQRRILDVTTLVKSVIKVNQEINAQVVSNKFKNIENSKEIISNSDMAKTQATEQPQEGEKEAGNVIVQDEDVNATETTTEPTDDIQDIPDYIETNTQENIDKEQDLMDMFYDEENYQREQQDNYDTAPKYDYLPADEIYDVRVDKIHIDPERFQFRYEGTTKKLVGSKWNSTMAGTILLWSDEHGDLYVVNGHHRVELAKANDVKTIRAEILSHKDYTAEQARMEGALINIAEGNADAVDVAKLFKDGGITVEQMIEYGINPNSKLAKDGFALAQLNDWIFTQVATKAIPKERAVIIGRELGNNKEGQNQIIKAIDKLEVKGKNITNSILTELIAETKGTAQDTFTETTLFGEETFTKNYSVERAEVVSYVKGQLRDRVSLLKNVSKEKNAKILNELGNTIAVDDNVKDMNEAEQALWIIDKTLNYQGTKTNELFNNLAKEYADAKDKMKVKKKAVKELIKLMEGGELLNDALNRKTSRESAKESIKTARTDGEGRQESRIDLQTAREEQLENQVDLFGNEVVNQLKEMPSVNVVVNEKADKNTLDTIMPIVEAMKNNVIFNGVDVNFTGEESKRYWTREELDNAGYYNARTDIEYETAGYYRPTRTQRGRDSTTDSTRDNINTSKASIYINNGATKDTILHEALHHIQQVIKENDPDLMLQIATWELDIRQEAARQNKSIPGGNELLVHVLVHGELGYAKDNEIGDLISIDDDIVKDIKNILGEEMLNLSIGEDIAKPSKERQLQSKYKNAAQRMFMQKGYGSNFMQAMEKRRGEIKQDLINNRAVKYFNPSTGQYIIVHPSTKGNGRKYQMTYFSPKYGALMDRQYLDTQLDDLTKDIVDEKFFYKADEIAYQLKQYTRDVVDSLYERQMAEGFTTDGENKGIKITDNEIVELLGDARIGNIAPADFDNLILFNDKIPGSSKIAMVERIVDAVNKGLDVPNSEVKLNQYLNRFYNIEPFGLRNAEDMSPRAYTVTFNPDTNKLDVGYKEYNKQGEVIKDTYDTFDRLEDAIENYKDDLLSYEPTTDEEIQNYLVGKVKKDFIYTVEMLKSSKGISNAKAERLVVTDLFNEYKEFRDNIETYRHKGLNYNFDMKPHYAISYQLKGIINETYYRNTWTNSPMSEWGHAMFAVNSQRVEGYGDNNWEYNGYNAVPIESLKEEIKNKWQENIDTGVGNIDTYYDTLTSEEIYNSFNPKDIVNSAEGWDNVDLYKWFIENILEDSNIDAITTQDGAIVFNEDLIERRKEYQLKAAIDTPEFKKWFKDSKVVDAEGNPLVVYHGTNRQFDVFDINKNRTILNDDFQGDGFFFSPSESVAQKYSTANRNQNIDKNLFLSTLKEKYSMEVYNYAKSLIEQGYEKTWDEIWDKGTDNVHGLSARFEEQGLDINRIADLTEYVEGSLSAKSDDDFNIFGGYNYLPDWVNEELNNIGLNKVVAEERVIPAYLSIQNLLVTDNPVEVKQAKTNGYDGVLYTGNNTVDEVPEYIVFNPTQIKSIYNNGMFSEYDSNINYQLKPVNVEGFYSKLEQSLDRLPAKAPGQDMYNILKKLGVKQEELDWFEIESFIGEKSVTREDILNKMMEKPIEFTKKDIGNRFNQYTLDGGDNYRFNAYVYNHEGKPFRSEVHFNSLANVIGHTRYKDRIGANGEAILFIEEVQSDWHQKGRQEGYANTVNVSELKALEDEVANIYDKAKELTLAIHSKQEEKDKIADLPNELEKILALPNGKDIVLEWGRLAEEENNLVKERRELYIKADSKRAIINRMYEGMNSLMVPDAPLKESIIDFLFKTAIKDAVEGGYDYISWTTGEQQADRYNVRKFVDKIEWRTDEENSTDGQLVGFKDGRSVISEMMTENELVNYLGKSLADKLITQENEEYGSGGYVKRVSGEDISIGGEFHKKLYDNYVPRMLKKYGKKWGLNIDEIFIGDTKSIAINNAGGVDAIVQKTNDLAKETQSDVIAYLNDGEIRIEVETDNHYTFGNPEYVSYGSVVYAASADEVYTSTQMQMVDEMNKLLENSNELTQPSIPVTPQMIEDVMTQGQPLFQLKEVPETNGNLLAMHNLNIHDLNNLSKLGGIPMPSIAITNKNISMGHFGNVSLIFNKDTIDPENELNKVYSRDAWTPMFPTVYMSSSGDYIQDKMGNVYEPTLDNILKVMSSSGEDLRNAVSGNYSSQHLLAGTAKEFKTIDHAKLYDYTIQDYDTVINRIKEYEQEYDKLIEDIYEYNYGESDRQGIFINQTDLNRVLNTAMIELQDRLRFSSEEYKMEQYKNLLARMDVDIDDNLAKRISDLSITLEEMPTGYFEAKPKRIISFNEVQAAMIDVISIKNGEELQEIKDILKTIGVEVIEQFTSRYEDDRQRALNNILRQNDVSFQLKEADTTTKEFKNFIKDSKAVDKEGKPLKVYHGTPLRGNSTKPFSPFSEFEKKYTKDNQVGYGIHFTPDYEFADYYTEAEGHLFAVYLSIKNPLELDQIVEEGTPLYDLALKANPNAYSMMNNDTGKRNIYLRNALEAIPPKKAEKAIMEAGYDGVIYEAEMREYDYYGYKVTDKARTYVVFNPTQIKSVYNQGTWNVNDPNIYYQLKEEPDIKERSWGQTVRDANITEQWLTDLLTSNQFMYEVKHNEDTIIAAAKLIQEKGEEYVEARLLSDIQNDTVLFAASQILTYKYMEDGEQERAMSMLEKTAEKATSMGQAIQILSVWGRQTPEGMLRTTAKLFRDNMTEKDRQEVTKKTKELTEAFNRLNRQAIENIDLVGSIDKVKNMTAEEQQINILTTTEEGKKLVEKYGVESIANREGISEEDLKKIESFLDKTPIDDEMGSKIIDTIKQHYIEGKGNLKDKLIAIGLNDFEAEILSKYVKQQMKDYAKDEKMSLLDNLPRQKYERKGIDEKLLDDIASGKLDEDTIKSYVGEKNGLPVLNKELMDYIYEQGQYINSLEPGREKDIETGKLIQEIMNNVPVNFWGKLRTIQTIHQLLNFKTTLRNLIGNDMFRRLDTFTLNFLGTPIDKLLAMNTKQRTMLFRYGEAKKLQTQGYKQGWKLGLEDALLGIDTFEQDTKFELRSQRVFTSGVYAKLETALNIAMRATDRAAYTASFMDSLQEQMELAGVDTPTDEMTERAAMLGLYRTFNDETALSNMFSGIKRALNKPGSNITGGEFGLGELIMKYPKTPANILGRAIDYSPMGLLVTMAKLYGETDPYLKQRMVTEGMSRALMGTGLIALGAILAKMGVLTGSNPDDDEDIYKLEKAYGLRDFSVNVSAIPRHILSGFKDPTAGELKKGDHLASYDWNEPIAMPLAVGADVILGSGEVMDLLSVIARTAETGATTLTDQPLLTGVATLFRGGNVVEGMGEVLKGVGSSFTPSLMAHVAQFIDGRDTDPYTFYGRGRQSWNLVQNRVPGLRGNLPSRYTVLGDEKRYFPEDVNMFSRAFNIFINPSITGRYMPPTEAEFIFDLYNATNDKDVVPRPPQKSYTIDKVKYTFTPESWEEMSKWLGKEYKARIGYAMNTYMRGWTAEEQAEEIKWITKEVKDEAKEKVKELGTKVE